MLAPDSASSFRAFAATQPGPVGIAIEPLATKTITELGAQQPAHAWSTSKVPVLATLIKSTGAQGLTSSELQEAQLAITESDNQSILDLFADLETRYGGLIPASDQIDALLRAAGDDHTTIATAPPPPGAVTTFGQTEWTPAQSATFFRALADHCVLNSPQTLYVIGLMEHVIPSESWGIGSAGFSKPVAFKGGWGPEGSAYLVRQSGIVNPASHDGVAIAIVAHPPAGSTSFETGTQMVTATAQWIRAHLKLPEDGVPASC